MNSDELMLLVEEKISLYMGLTLSKVQHPKLLKYLEERSQISGKSLEQYVKDLDSSSKEFQLIVNQVTVNETYFFREHIQFDFLKEKVFPKFAGKKMNIWSGACATGEEPVSLLVLALECGVDATVYASDIDNTALDVLKKGVYHGFSFRTDGSKYHEMLKKYGKTTSNGFELADVYKSRIQIFKINLIDSKVYPFSSKMDLVFLRNVFIYFNKENRLSVTKKIAEVMNDGAPLFFSMNEVGSFSKEFNDFGLYKTHYGTLYYFEKEKAPVLMEFNDLKMDESRKNVKDLIQEVHERFQTPEEERKSSIIKAEIRSSTERPGLHERKPAKTVKENLHDNLAQIFEKICGLINKSKFDLAMEEAKKLENQRETKSYSKFLQGYVEYYNDNKENAIKLFEAAYMLKGDFWPTYFYGGLALKDTGNNFKADKYFKECIHLLDEDSLVNGKYNFLLDSFDPVYIKKLCETLQSGEK